MKKLTSTLCALFFVALAAVASTPDAAFDFDEAAIEQEFAAIEQIESFVTANDGVTLSQLSAEKTELLNGVTLLEDTSAVFTTKEMPIVGGFWWGCCLGIVGLALVYFISDNDRDQVKKALIGCIISTLVVGLGGVFDVFNWF